MEDAIMLPVEGLDSEQIKRQEDEFAKQRILGYWMGIREGVSPFVAGEIQNWMLANKEMFPTLTRDDFTSPEVREKLPAVEAALRELGLIKPTAPAPTPTPTPVPEEEPTWLEKLKRTLIAPLTREKPAGAPAKEEKPTPAPVDIDLRRKVMAEIGRLFRQNLTGDEIIRRIRKLYGEAGAKIAEEGLK
jgi:outer membrane biosynthesis protein TonB